MGNAIKFTYTNYRGETAIRTVIPKNVYYGRNEWHPELQWLMTAYDIDKEDFRTFALKDCDFTKIGE